MREIITDELLDLFAEKFLKIKRMYAKEGLVYQFTFEEFVARQLWNRERVIIKRLYNG